MKTWKQFNINENFTEISKKDIEKIVRKHFQQVNKEGVGFLTTNMDKCIDDICKLLKIDK